MFDKAHRECKIKKNNKKTNKQSENFCMVHKECCSGAHKNYPSVFCLFFVFVNETGDGFINKEVFFINVKKHLVSSFSSLL